MAVGGVYVARRRVDGIKAGVVEVGRKQADHLVVGTLTLDGTLRLRLGANLGRLEAELASPELPVAVLLAVTTMESPSKDWSMRP